MSIAVKLGAGFGAVIVLMVVIALVALSRLAASDADTRYVAKNALPSVELIAGVKTSAFDYHGVALEEVLAVDPAEMPELDGELDAAATNVDKALARYRNLVSDPRDRALYEKTVSSWKTYLSKIDGFTDAAHKLKADAASERLDNGDDAFDATLVAVDKWQAYNDGLAAKKVEQSHATYKSGRALTLVLLLVAIALGVGLAVTITRQIKRVVSVVLDRLGMLRDNCATDLRGGPRRHGRRRPDHRGHARHAADREPRQGRARPDRRRRQRDPQQHHRLRRGLQRDARGAQRHHRRRFDVRRHRVLRVAADGGHVGRGRPCDR